MFSLCEHIKNELKNKDLGVVAKSLGYANIQKGINRINEMIALFNCSLATVDDANYDGVHANQTLFKSLCKICGVDDNLIERELYAISCIKRSYEEANYKHIYINTDFKRASQPIFVLAAMEGRRIISKLNYLQQFSLKRQIIEVSSIVRNNYEKNDGKLQLWGNIKNYAYHYSQDHKPIVFSTNGDVLDGVEVFESHATLEPNIFAFV